MTSEPAGGTDDASASRRLLIDNPYLLLAFASLCWSANHIIGRAIAGHIPPVLFSTLRWLIPAILIFLIARTQLRGDWPIIRRNWRIIVFLGITGGAIYGVGQYVGLALTTALNVSVLNSTAPVFIVMAGWLIFRDRFTSLQAAGIACSLLGVIVIVTRAELQALLSLSFNAGDLIITANQMIWAVYSVFLRKRPQLDLMSFMFAFAVISTVTTTPFAVAEYAAGARMDLSWLTVGAIVFVGIFPSFLAFTSWTRGIAMIGSNRAGPFLHLIPLYSAVMATVFLGERLMLYHALGFALILAGVWLAARRRDAPEAG